MRSCAGECLYSPIVSICSAEAQKNNTYRRSCPQSLDLGLAVLAIQLHHAPTRPVQRPACDGSSSRCVIDDALLVRDLEPDYYLTDRGVHELKRALNGRMDNTM